MKLTDEQRAELVAIINREGGAPGNSMHSWRCEDKDRYPDPCDCVEYVVDELAQAIESWLSSPPEGWEERKEAVVTGDPGDGFPPYRFIFGTPQDQSAHAYPGDAWDRADAFADAVNTHGGWPDGPHVKRRRVWTEQWQEADA